jgi:uncharacterized damage-inducible protein DinB
MHGAVLLLLAAVAHAQERLPLQDDMWREFDTYRVRLIQLAKATPEERYDWRPGDGVRSIKEVLLHVALNNYMLLDMMGRPVPAVLYPGLPATEPERQRAIAKKNLELEKQIGGKQKVIEAVEQAFDAAAIPLKEASAADLNRGAMFGDRKTTMGGLQFRLVVHLHEHLGQLIAYARSVGVTPPWSQ